jgi:hypothetical protein
MMKVEHFITVTFFLMCVLSANSLANTNDSSTQLGNEKAANHAYSLIGPFESDYEDIIYEQTGFEVDIDYCSLYMSMYPTGYIDMCITNAGTVFMMLDNRGYTVKAGTPPEFYNEIIKEEAQNNIKSMPNISDYGVSFQALISYIDAIQSVPLETCQKAYDDKNPDGAYCKAKREAGIERSMLGAILLLQMTMPMY